MKLDDIIKEIKKDKRNTSYSDKGLKPLLQIDKDARILLIGQAPGKKAQEAQKLFDDKSGEKLRDWLALDEKTFYSKDIAILPMDFYYPGKAKTGDKPPRKFIANEYHKKLIDLMPNIKLTILIGAHAQKYYLDKDFKKNLTQTVKAYEDYLPEYFPLVHPSPLNNRWLAKNPFFEKETIPDLRKIVKDILV